MMNRVNLLLDPEWSTYLQNHHLSQNQSEFQVLHLVPVYHIQHQHQSPHHPSQIHPKKSQDFYRNSGYLGARKEVGIKDKVCQQQVEEVKDKSGEVLNLKDK